MVDRAIVGQRGIVHWAQPCLAVHVSIPRNVRTGADGSGTPHAKYLITMKARNGA
jgi:hypothetical protein